MFTLAKLVRILKPYTFENKLTSFEQNLFSSFFSKKETIKEQNKILSKGEFGLGTE